MNLVYDKMKSNDYDSKPKEKRGVLESWLMSNSGPSIAKYKELESSDFKKKLSFTSNYHIFDLILLYNYIFNNKFNY